MPMTVMTPNTTEPELPRLHLSVQYAVPYPPASRPQVRRWVAAALDVVAQHAELTMPGVTLCIRFCDADESQQLNLEYRGRDKATNVLTFAYGIDPESQNLVADILICVPVLEAEAQAQHKNSKHHAAHLCVHGVLHALGYDHEHDDEAKEMECLEAKILQRFSIANPYATA